MAIATDAFDRLQEGLEPALAANRADSGIDHVMIAMPSYSVSESLLSHYGDRVASLEHRYLNALLITGRILTCHILVFLSRLPDPAVVDYYVSLMRPEVRESARSRIRLIEVDDGTSGSVATKLLNRTDLLDEARSLIAGRPVFIEPWNVTEQEVALALALGAPINGTRPELRDLGFKSEGRRLIRQAGVPVPLGVEDVRTVDDVVVAVESIRVERPDLGAIVIKHDDSGAGDGNVVLDLAPMRDAPDPTAWLRARVEGLPEWYLADLAGGGVVEERIAGQRFSSPSAQVDLRPDGEAVVLATHEQVLGGDSGQVYLGCRFPADPAYAPELARHAAAIGRELAAAGAHGRFSVDFVAAADRTSSWRVYAIEINLRKGGTTHPYTALRNVVPGRYDPAAGQWVAYDGTPRVYSSTDNLVDPAWKGLEPAAVIRAVADAGLQFDWATGTGVVLHMLSGLAIDGRIGLTAIATSPEEAAQTHAAVQGAITSLPRSGA